MKEISTETASETVTQPLEHVVTEKTVAPPAPETHHETVRTETHHEQVPAKDVEVKEVTTTGE